MRKMNVCKRMFAVAEHLIRAIVKCIDAECIRFPSRRKDFDIANILSCVYSSEKGREGSPRF